MMVALPPVDLNPPSITYVMQQRPKPKPKKRFRYHDATTAFTRRTDETDEADTVQDDPGPSRRRSESVSGSSVAIPS